MPVPLPHMMSCRRTGWGTGKLHGVYAVSAVLTFGNTGPENTTKATADWRSQFSPSHEVALSHAAFPISRCTRYRICTHITPAEIS